MDVYVATKNGGKLRELQAIFTAFGWRLRTYERYADVDEGSDSYVENAALKARALFLQLRAAGIEANVLGDDSGLEVDALAGRPGVRSARYGGPDADWPQRRAMLLAEIAASGSGRGAAFVCALDFIDVTGCETRVLRRLRGYIADRERGEAGFSYDPIFALDIDGSTFAQLQEAQKNAISHRALAARALIETLDAEAARLPAQKVGFDGT